MSWTLADVLETAGLSRAAHVPIAPMRAHRVASWPDGFGWWWAVLDFRIDHVVACGWTTGNRRDRDDEVRLAIQKLPARAVAS